MIQGTRKITNRESVNVFKLLDPSHDTQIMKTGHMSCRKLFSLRKNKIL